MNPRKVITRVLVLAAVLLVAIVAGAVAAFGVDYTLEAVELTVRGYDALDVSAPPRSSNGGAP